jgi:hypothetical protein
MVLPYARFHILHSKYFKRGLSNKLSIMIVNSHHKNTHLFSEIMKLTLDTLKKLEHVNILMLIF